MSLPLRLVNLWDSHADNFEMWARSFCNTVSSESGGQPQWLLGYSLGGRLALHALIERPALWAGVIVIGAHPGFSTVAERQQQLLKDLSWGNRFLVEPWDELLSTWDALPVFGNHPNTLPRKETDFSRAKIARLFDIFSKGRQQNMLPALAQLSRPALLLITGEQDVKYRKISEEILMRCSIARHTIIPNTCHRVPWEAPLDFQKAVQHFLNTHAQIN